ncbi:hypothetical protein [Halomicrococcus sp. SG-WS-1]|uniref:hypothetical protein n=1 Tax=Halomicrococcus sp. SG-WS-1 TaxID=3439057 RepID=UPI003F7AF320
MDDLQIDALRDYHHDDIAPTEKTYSITLIDSQRPPSDPKYARKGYETDRIAVPDLPDPLNMLVIAYQADGTVSRLDDPSGSSPLQKNA